MEYRLPLRRRVSSPRFSRDRISAAFSEDPDFDAEAAFREVIDVMRMHVSAGEIEDIRRAMPEELRVLWEDDLAA